MNRYFLLLLILSKLLSVVSTPCFAQKPGFKVLAFYSTKVESDHVNFSNDLRAFMKNLAVEQNFTFDATTDWTNLNDTLLSNYQVVMWINDFPQNENQRTSFQKYMENGGGWVGFHVSGYNDKTTKWPWYLSFLGGGVFHSNSWPPIPARLIVDDNNHPVTKRLAPAYASPVNEWYQWKPSPRENKDVKVLVSLDPENYPLGIKDILTGGDNPVVWTNTKYNMIYMNMGHGDKVMSDYMQNNMITDALLWVGRKGGNSVVGATTKNTALVSNLVPAMVNVEGGNFKMGDETGQGNKDEMPVHEVRVKNFKIAKTETTVAQWRMFCNATNRKMPDIPAFGWQEDHPIVNVSWDDATAYCYWLNEKGGSFRLPTEAEWEFAARGGLKTKSYKYSGGNNIDSVGWYGGKGGYSTKAVAKKLPNELGLYDMAGNVYEWVSDGYDGDYYTSSPKDNPKGPKNPRFYVLRSGGFDNESFKSRMTYRNILLPSRSNFNKGFRLAAD
jgi:formylglycine-generating enzyme required for sulfatase activity